MSERDWTWRPTLADFFAANPAEMDFRMARDAVASPTDLQVVWDEAVAIVRREWLPICRVAHQLRQVGIMSGNEFTAAWYAARER